LIGLATYYAVFRYRKALQDAKSKEAAGPTKTSTAPSAYKKPSLNKNDYVVTNETYDPYYSGYTYEKPASYNEPYLDPQILSSFKNVLSKLQTHGHKESSWSPISSNQYQ